MADCSGPDAVWDMASRGAEAELKLRRDLEEMRVLHKKSVSKWHTIINDHIVDVGVGNLQGMGPSNFAAWMSGKRLSKKRIGAGAMRGMRHFVSNWDGSASPN